MAGIGFRLQRLLRGGTYTGLLEAYAYAALLAAGPWLVTVAVIAALSLLAPAGLAAEELSSFRATVVYIYMVTLVTTGPLQLVASRYLADRIWLQDLEAITPSFFTALLATLGAHAVLGGVAAFALGMQPLYAIGTMGLFAVVAGLWLAITFLSAAKEYEAIAVAFVLGAVVSIGAAVGLGTRFGLTGYLYGFLCGQLLTLVLLVARAFIEFEAEHVFEPGVLKALGTHADLALAGLLYYGGIWIDKFVFAWSPLGEEVRWGLRAHPGYEGAIFLAYLTVIPALALFMIRVETGLYGVYRGFFAAILEGYPLAELRARQQQIAERFRVSVGRVVRLQGAVTALAILAAPRLLELLRFQPVQVPVFQIGCVAAFLQVLLLLLVVALLYLEQRRTALGVCLVFFASNGLLSWLSLQLGLAWHGYGYAMACLLALAIGYLALDRAVRELDRETFLRQPLVAAPLEAPRLERPAAG
ncbi:MAG: pellicle/biofilm biosynthesis Wzx-like polysaccharide transporter PelG [Planctomycetota bacterium]|nr:MAG: pellicle/biofilm biosynthesis Wzx-like polysaccharide transporter PelG [Planctomycetota bacterium]